MARLHDADSSQLIVIEAAIMECAWAGCETIWVCLRKTPPLVRHRIGDFVQDPVWAWRSMDPQPTAKQRRINFLCPSASKE